MGEGLQSWGHAGCMEVALMWRRDKELVSLREEALKKCTELNQLHTSEREKQAVLVKMLFGSVGENSFITPPFNCDYGSNIFAGACSH